jgi:hypothetical protein
VLLEPAEGVVALADGVIEIVAGLVEVEPGLVEAALGGLQRILRRGELAPDGFELGASLGERLGGVVAVVLGEQGPAQVGLRLGAELLGAGLDIGHARHRGLIEGVGGGSGNERVGLDGEPEAEALEGLGERRLALAHLVEIRLEGADGEALLTGELACGGEIGVEHLRAGLVLGGEGAGLEEVGLEGFNASLVLARDLAGLGKGRFEGGGAFGVRQVGRARLAKLGLEGLDRVLVLVAGLEGASEVGLECRGAVGVGLIGRSRLGEVGLERLDGGFVLAMEGTGAVEIGLERLGLLAPGVLEISDLGELGGEGVGLILVLLLELAHALEEPGEGVDGLIDLADALFEDLRSLQHERTPWVRGIDRPMKRVGGAKVA